MLLAHKIELRPTEEQKQYLLKAFGIRRHCYNQLLAHFSNPENKWSKKAGYEYYIKYLRQEFPWYKDVSIRVSRNAIDDLDKAFKHFFRRVKEASKEVGFPTFKKHGINESFALRESVKFSVSGRDLRIEKLQSVIKMRQPLRLIGFPKQVTISTRAGKFFASILVEVNHSKDYLQYENKRYVGVDLGVKNLATFSDGTVFPENQALKDDLKRLTKAQKQLSRKQRGSNHYADLKERVSKLHYLISCKREHVLHELTTYLISNYDVICIEDLNVSGMVRNHKLARAILDAGFGMFREMLEYKARLNDKQIVTIDRFYPSSKTCSQCGVIKDDLTLSDRTFTCKCGLSIDRDLNAAMNILECGRHRLEGDLKRTKEASKTQPSCALPLTA